MDALTAGMLCLGLLMAAMLIGMPIGLTFIFSGFLTAWALGSLTGALNLLGSSLYHTIDSPTMVCIPLFLFMGGIASIGGFARRAFESLSVLTARVPGGLGIATCYSCAAFGAISGSTMATAAIFGRLAYPEMLAYGYNKDFSAACIASAGTFAAMIPPSTMFIIYALFTQSSVGRLFAAGVVPGVLTAVIYAIYIYWRAKRFPDQIPSTASLAARLTRQERTRRLTGIWPVLIIAFAVLGGIYGGVLTTTEAAAAGCFLTLALSLILREIPSYKAVFTEMKASAASTAMLFLINVGALYYSRILAMSRLPTEITSYLNSIDVAPVFILIGLLLVMFILGMVMIPVGIFALTLPIIVPILQSYNWDVIWFGVLAVKLTEIGCITPPVGLNIYAIKGILGKDSSLEGLFKGVWPFVIIELIALVILTIFPSLSLWLPDMLFNPS